MNRASSEATDNRSEGVRNALNKLSASLLCQKSMRGNIEAAGHLPENLNGSAVVLMERFKDVTHRESMHLVVVHFVVAQMACSRVGVAWSACYHLKKSNAPRV